MTQPLSDQASNAEIERLTAEVKLQNGWAHDLMRERDHYRRALEKIAARDPYVHGWEIAAEALAASDEEER